MCGITGAIDTSAERAAQRVAQLNQGQRHRGPDHAVVARAGLFTLGNTRLAIQDPGPSGNQPFTSPDGRYLCVFNGEIYNYRELISRYSLPVRSNCDGEVIPALWSKLGAAALAELRGMFAIALVDTLEERLYLARDPFGIKPLYWRPALGGLLFASEIRPLLQVGGPARTDPGAVARYLRLGSMAATQTPFRDITALPPNSVASIGRTCLPVIGPIQPGGPISPAGTPTDLGQALTESVRLHLSADVPTALLLSSGVDSTAIAAIGHRLGQQLNCLTVATGLDANAGGPDLTGPDAIGTDESGPAQETARHYGHRFQRVPAVLTADDVTKFFRAMQRPTIDGLNTFVVCRAVHEAGFKVALSGLGGDEAVGGYPHFRLLPFLPAVRAGQRLPRPVARLAGTALSRLGAVNEAKAQSLLAADGPRDGWGLSRLQREVFPSSLVTELTGVASEHEGDVGPAGTTVRADQLSLMTAAEVALYLQATLLADADAFSMTSSVELRVPFVDGAVFSSALGLATRRPIGKQAIGRALADPYLADRARRPKRGFSLPMRQWMNGPLAPTLRAAEDPGAPVWSLLDRAVVTRAGLLPFRAGRRWSEAWAVAALNAWLETI
jgi:asparagine synthase (glutamine-hydrolysing)